MFFDMQMGIFLFYAVCTLFFYIFVCLIKGIGHSL